MAFCLCLEANEYRALKELLDYCRPHEQEDLEELIETIDNLRAVREIKRHHIFSRICILDALVARIERDHGLQKVV